MAVIHCEPLPSWVGSSTDSADADLGDFHRFTLAGKEPEPLLVALE
jgi:hypothetical protein